MKARDGGRAAEMQRDEPKDQLSMMWMEGVGGLGGWPTCKGTKAETNVRNRLCRATVEHGLRQLAAAQGEKFERPRNAEGRMLEPLMGNHVDSAATIQHGITSWTKERRDDWGA